MELHFIIVRLVMLRIVSMNEDIRDPYMKRRRCAALSIASKFESYVIEQKG